jgi:hypothetical protein
MIEIVIGAPNPRYHLVQTGNNGAYSIYNWELFYHIPVTVAVHLSKTRRYAEAQRWFHYVFNPLANDTSVDPSRRFWSFLQFRKDPKPKQIDYLLTLLSESPAGLSDDDKKLQQASCSDTGTRLPTGSSKFGIA